MLNYQDVAKTFNLDGAVQEMLSGSVDQLNACYECCDRHAEADCEKVALYWQAKDGRKEQYTFAQLKKWSSQFANFLKSQGIQAGDRISGLLPRTPELLVVILAAWRIGAVYQPLFTAFGPKAIEHRVQLAKSKLVVTDIGNRSKLDEVAQCPQIMTVADQQGHAVQQGDLDFWKELNQQAEQCDLVMQSIQDPFLLMFTSGTTGPAKPLEVPLKALIAFGNYMKDAIGLRADDAFWNIADPGWAYGLYYGITGPLLLGHATLFYEGGFSIDSLCQIIDDYKITNLAGAPTAYRMMMAADPTQMAQLKGKFRVVSSAGEPLNPEVFRWFKQVLDAPIFDHYGQTEVGMVVCNHHGLSHEVRAGAAGFASPGYRVAVVDDQGNELPADTAGILAVDISQSPMMWFGGYKESRKSPFIKNYYLTGDTAELHANGSMSFVGRSDDVITTSGYRIGPFDVESALLEHEAVIEAAVVGVPDPERTEIVKAFVILAENKTPSEELAEQLGQFVKKRLSAHAYPRQVEFVTELPKTPSGKIQRFLLRNQEIAKQQLSV
ncbi:AMP-binding protein [Acinetobacter guillouiae]|uniref:AMP-binding protein n=1 Tax=Acinetobacter TaxID=469 RepID=UPI00141B7CAE|nr:MULTISPECIES: AMP-binding protein [Acinetobacter]MCS4296786.1 acetyl-CoA synthetase [Acinetobacter guillouiae]MCU4491406.1 AMP-binding protein [Acinetobacter guillouiae]MCW2250908.1 acetyl-CoA synthetase [Acinetobacter sp. BIGb0204]NII36994.1 acetyl-CoA synthetase [Acinetobacter sp. BIGb0196]